MNMWRTIGVVLGISMIAIVEMGLSVWWTSCVHGA